MRKSILILLFAMLGIFSAQAYDFEVNGIYYNITNSSAKKVEVTAKSSHYDDRYSGSVVIPSSVTYNKTTYTVTSIGEEAFSECNGLTSVTIPASVTSIGRAAFIACSSLRSVTIPESVTSVGFNAFGGTAISSPLYNSKVFAYMPEDYNGVYSIPSGIQLIAAGAFYGCRFGLTSVTIPESVTSIGWGAFFYCSGLTSVTIGEGVAAIEGSAFASCISLTSITIPASVTSIGESAFYGCSGLKSVKSLAKTPPSCADNAFGTESYYTIPLYVPAGSKLLYVGAKGWQKFVQMEELAATTYTVTVKVNDASMGSVTGGGVYQQNVPVTLVAVAKQGYKFVRWDDGITNPVRSFMVTQNITLTAIFAKNNNVANESPEADNFCVYAQDRTIYLSEDRGLVQVYNMIGQCVYNGHATAIPVQQGGVYVVVANNKRIKVLVK